MKRLVVAVFVSTLTVVGVAPAASAATSDSAVKVVKVVKVKKIKPVAIDWDSAPATTEGTVSTQRIDWD
ncbi:MAG: hypothetical protein JWR55_3163 [Aeromicrobium sp.]|jgi:hypothetical protein|nr:hypothetical protein [Aeromicrobium sp.]